MMGSGSLSLKMMTGTEWQGLQQVSPTGLTLRTAEGCFIKESQYINVFFTNDNAILYS